MFRSTVYHRNSILGEAEVHPTSSAAAVGAWIREIRISHFSPSSDRCPPLAVLHTIASNGPCFRLESKSQPSNESPLFSLYAACLQENKTAVVPLGDEELHLVAMSSRKNLVQYSCFWGFTVVPNLYNSCLVMLNLRCLGIVFDLDETLIVANTMRSFEDKIDALQRRINNETDSQRVIGMLAEVKRYQDDKLILKQYIENNQVVENGKVFEVQPENVPPLSDTHQLITRPIIRLPEKKIILTRVNPTIRDTSVLVRLRPAWEELRSYLTARGRKRFEVYVCTMAERDYALEMWRLLDPESCLINSRDLLDRIVCVKSGLKKSLLNVFQDGTCHPKMSLVIDDRLKVWNEKDQPRVHVVPAFAPYYAPQAEANNSIPVLCLARNVACNVRGSFFKEFDEGLLPRITDIFYEDEMIIFPSPDVGNYLTAEDDTSAPNGNKDLPCIDGMINVDSERRLKDANNGVTVQIVPPVVNHFDPNAMSTLQRPMVSSSSAVMLTANPLMMPLPNNQLSQPIAQCRLLGISGFQEPSLQGSPAREEGEVPESELDPDTRRRLLILQHGQDTRDPPPPPPFSVRPPPLQVTMPPVQSESTWFPPDGEMNPRQPRRAPKGPPLEPEDIHFARKRSHNPLFFPSRENFVPSDRVSYDNQPLPRQQGPYRNDRSHLNHTVSNSRSFSGEAIPVVRPSSNCRDTQLDFGPTTAHYVGTPPQILLEIAKKCGTKVEFRSSLCDTTELQFHIEAWFVGEKIGEGIGRTRKEAQYQAAEKSLRYLANKYLANSLHDPTAVLGDLNKLSHTKGNGFISDSNSFGYPASIRDDLIPSTSEESRLLDIKPDEFKKPHAPVAALKELCVLEGYNLDFQVQPSPLMSSVGKNEVYVEVEVAGQILGKGVGATREEAKLQAAEEALENFKSMLGQVTQKRSGGIRQFATNPSKRLRQDFSRELSRTSPSGRYPKNETFMS